MTDRLEQLGLTDETMPAVPVRPQEIGKAVRLQATHQRFPTLFQTAQMMFVIPAPIEHGKQIILQQVSGGELYTSRIQGFKNLVGIQLIRHRDHGEEQAIADALHQLGQNPPLIGLARRLQMTANLPVKPLECLAKAMFGGT